jgi:sulfide dehydrogenase [flavocytochrome c] flavoprotein chain
MPPSSPSLDRRNFLRLIAASGVLAGCASRPQTSAAAAGRVVVIGGGYGGATAARHLREFRPDVEVVMIDRNTDFVSCPMSNLVLSGALAMRDITLSYAGLRKAGVRVVRDEVVAVDTENKKIRLSRLEELPFDRLVVSPGVDFMYEQIPGLDNAGAQKRILHAWKAGPELSALKKQLEDMKDGGVYVLTIPGVPFRCPPAPYERACQVALYLQRNKPRSKVIVLDANEDIASEKYLFLKAWNERYKGMVEYRNNSEVRDVDVTGMAVKLDFDTVHGDVLNVLPPMKAGAIASRAGLVTANDRWCGVDWLTMESLAAPGVHVLGDATLSAPQMPKSGQMAWEHGKLAANAIARLLHTDRDHGSMPKPGMQSVCYSFIDDKSAAQVDSMHVYDDTEKTIKLVPRSSHTSPAADENTGRNALAWAHTTWRDMLG